jgi:ElaB/YqjD/DUF883 family membrane-anchored ribosome-binding protein
MEENCPLIEDYMNAHLSSTPSDYCQTSPGSRRSTGRGPNPMNMERMSSSITRLSNPSMMQENYTIIEEPESSPTSNMTESSRVLKSLDKIELKKPKPCPDPQANPTEAYLKALFPKPTSSSLTTPPSKSISPSDSTPSTNHCSVANTPPTPGALPEDYLCIYQTDKENEPSPTADVAYFDFDFKPEIVLTRRENNQATSDEQPNNLHEKFAKDNNNEEAELEYLVTDSVTKTIDKIVEKKNRKMQLLNENINRNNVSGQNFRGLSRTEDVVDRIDEYLNRNYPLTAASRKYMSKSREINVGAASNQRAATFRSESQQQQSNTKCCLTPGSANFDPMTSNTENILHRTNDKVECLMQKIESKLSKFDAMSQHSHKTHQSNRSQSKNDHIKNLDNPTLKPEPQPTPKTPKLATRTTTTIPSKSSLPKVPNNDPIPNQVDPPQSLSPEKKSPHITFHRVSISNDEATLADRNPIDRLLVRNMFRKDRVLVNAKEFIVGHGQNRVGEDKRDLHRKNNRGILKTRSMSPKQTSSTKVYNDEITIHSTRPKQLVTFAKSACSTPPRPRTNSGDFLKSICSLVNKNAQSPLSFQVKRLSKLINRPSSNVKLELLRKR